MRPNMSSYMNHSAKSLALTLASYQREVVLLVIPILSAKVSMDVAVDIAFYRNINVPLTTGRGLLELTHNVRDLKLPRTKSGSSIDEHT
jgi:hypothetical protein